MIDVSIRKQPAPLVVGTQHGGEPLRLLAEELPLAYVYGKTLRIAAEGVGGVPHWVHGDREKMDAVCVDSGLLETCLEQCYLLREEWADDRAMRVDEAQ